MVAAEENRDASHLPVLAEELGLLLRKPKTKPSPPLQCQHPEGDAEWFQQLQKRQARAQEVQMD